MLRRSALALALAALPALARADIPPDPDSIAAHCTPTEQCPTGEHCPYAFNPGAPESEWKAEGAECRQLMASKGLEKRCRNGGNYSGQELFCPPGATGSWTPPGQTPPPPAPVPKPVALEPAPATPPPPAKAGPETPPPAKAGMCSVNDRQGSGLLALFALLALRRRRT